MANGLGELRLSAKLRRLLAKGLARRWLWVQLAACATLLSLCGLDLLMVYAKVSCSTYRRTIQGLPGELVAISSLALGGAAFLWRVGAQILTGQYRSLAWSLGLLAIEVALVLAMLSIDIDKTLFYCSFQGLSLSPCAVGMCAR